MLRCGRQLGTSHIIGEPVFCDYCQLTSLHMLLHLATFQLVAFSNHICCHHLAKMLWCISISLMYTGFVVAHHGLCIHFAKKYAATNESHLFGINHTCDTPLRRKLS